MLEVSEYNYIATYYSFNHVLYRAYYNIYIAQLSDFSPNARNPFLYFENLEISHARTTLSVFRLW